MADPSIQTFCCHRVQDESEPVGFLSEFNSESYNIVCLVSSTIGIFGAIYQILPKERTIAHHRWVTVTSSRSSKIVVWLAVADLLASLGVFLRSVLWLNYTKWSGGMSEGVTTVLCALSAAWIQYFYTATWLWTLVYAIDLKLLLKEREGHPFRYHAAVWIIPALLTTFGLSILYIPDANCHDVHSLNTAIFRILPNYLANYVPMALVMIVNPCLYVLLTRDMEGIVSQSSGQVTSKERRTLDLIRMKFSLINVAFIVCWLPNLINGILVWTLWWDLPHDILLSLWYVMALMNPLQALFNSLVYRRWSGGAEKLQFPCSCSRVPISPLTSGDSCSRYADESTPLIGSSINCSSNSDEEGPNFKL